MSEQKKFITKIVNSFTPNMPFRIKEFIATDDNYISYATMYYGHLIPNWKNELVYHVQMKVSEYTQVPTIICISKKDYDKVRTRYGYGDVIINNDPYL